MPTSSRCHTTSASQPLTLPHVVKISTLVHMWLGDVIPPMFHQSPLFLHPPVITLPHHCKPNVEAYSCGLGALPSCMLGITPSKANAPEPQRHPIECPFAGSPFPDRVFTTGSYSMIHVTRLLGVPCPADPFSPISWLP